jgi:hypothetical protein
MDCDEPLLTLKEKTQPIQWIEWPIGALVATSSLWPCPFTSSFIVYRNSSRGAEVEHLLQRSLVLESCYWTLWLSTMPHKPFALVKHSSSCFCQPFSMWTPVQIATQAQTALQILLNKFGNMNLRTILVSISVITTTHFEWFMQVVDVKL